MLWISQIIFICTGRDLISKPKHVFSCCVPGKMRSACFAQQSGKSCLHFWIWLRMLLSLQKTQILSLLACLTWTSGWLWSIHIFRMIWKGFSKFWLSCLFKFFRGNYTIFAHLPCKPPKITLSGKNPTDAHVATKQIESPTQPQSKRGKKHPDVNPQIKKVVTFWCCGFYLNVVDIQTCSITAQWQTFPFICWLFSRFERGDNNRTYWVNLFQLNALLILSGFKSKAF